MRLSTFQRVQSLISNEEVSQYLNITGFSSEIGTKLRDWAVGQAGGSCYSWAALSSNDSKTRYFAYSCSPLAVAHTNSSLIAVLSPVEQRDFIFPAQLSRLS